MDAEKKFLAEVAKINELLVALQDLAEDHFDVDPTRITYAHVNTALDVRIALQGVLARAQGI